MPVFPAGRAGAGGSPTCCGTTWGAAWCHQPAPTPQAPPAVGATLGPATSPPRWHRLLGVARHKRGSPSAALLVLPKCPPNMRKLSWSHAHLWQEAVLGGSLISLILTTTRGNLKGKVLTAVLKSFQWSPMVNPKDTHWRSALPGSTGGVIETQKAMDPLLFLYFSPSDLHCFPWAWFIWSPVWLEPIWKTNLGLVPLPIFMHREQQTLLFLLVRSLSSYLPHLYRAGHASMDLRAACVSRI